MYSLQNRTALVTGASAGIGRSIAIRLAEEGCDIVLIDIDRIAAEGVAKDVSALGRQCIIKQADVSKRDDVMSAVSEALSEAEGIDICVNNAGIVRVCPVAEVSLEEWRHVFAVNVEGTLNVCQAALRHFHPSKPGRIINLSSWFGKTGQANYGAYSASKAAIIGMTQSMAAELAPRGITVNAVCPGTIVETRMREAADQRAAELGLPSSKERESSIPLGRVGLPADVARIVAFLASDESSYMTGQAINVTGGLWRH